jgi:transposase
MTEPHDLDAFLIDGEEEAPEANQLPPPKPRRSPGRPTKRNAVTVARIVDSVAHGSPLNMACAAAGVSSSSLARWRSGPAGKAISDSLQKAEGQFIEHHLAIIRQAATAGTWTASAWLLERRYPEHFGRRLQTEKHVDQHITVESSQELIDFSARMERLVPDESARKELAVEILRLGEHER